MDYKIVVTAEAQRRLESVYTVSFFSLRKISKQRKMCLMILRILLKS